MPKAGLTPRQMRLLVPKGHDPIGSFKDVEERVVRIVCSEGCEHRITREVMDAVLVPPTTTKVAERKAQGHEHPPTEQQRHHDRQDLWDIAACRLEEAQASQAADLRCNCLGDCGTHTPNGCVKLNAVLAVKAYGLYSGKQRGLCESCARALLSRHQLGLNVLDCQTT